MTDAGFVFFGYGVTVAVLLSYLFWIMLNLKRATVRSGRRKYGDEFDSI